MAASLAGAGRIVHCLDHPIPAWQRGPLPRIRFTAAGGPATGRELACIALAALATLSLGAVLGPEAPLVAIGGGLAALTVRLAKMDAHRRRR